MREAELIALAERLEAESASLKSNLTSAIDWIIRIGGQPVADAFTRALSTHNTGDKDHD